jgi:hypothetical protein
LSFALEIFLSKSSLLDFLVDDFLLPLKAAPVSLPDFVAIYLLPNKPELPGFLLIDPPFAAKVLTIVGLPPTPCRLDLFLATALFFWLSVMLAAFAAGTHFGYDLPLFFDALFRPHS